MTKAKFATDIPSAITMPDRVETRLGTLQFTDGFPDDATVEKVFDNLDFQHAVQAFLTSMPAASLAAIRKAARDFGPDNQTVTIFESLMDSRSLYLTANTESIYAMVWLDLKNGPIVVESPPNTLGLVDDFWFRYVTDLGIAGPDKGKGGKFLFLPPDFTGTPPEGYHTFKSRTFNNWFGTRGFQVNGDPKPGVDAIKQQLRIYPLADAAKPPATNFINVSGKAFNTIHAMDASFFEEVNEVVQEEPADAIDPETLGLLASIGIEKGTPFAPDARMKKILAEAAAVGQATVRALAYRCRVKEAFFYPDSAWNTPFIGGSHEFLHQGARLLDARSYFFFYATGITPAMAIQKVGAGSAYAAAFVDAKKPAAGRRQDLQAASAGRHSRPSSSGRWCSTTRRRARCCRPISSSPASAARRRAWRSTPIPRSMSTSVRRRRQARRATGYRPGPARDGPSFFVSTVRCSRSSTRRGDPARLKKSADARQPERTDMADQPSTMPSADTIREERAYMLGTAAYLWGFTMNELYPARSHALATPGAAVNTFAHRRALLTPEMARKGGVVRSNSATLYSSAWLISRLRPL